MLGRSQPGVGPSLKEPAPSGHRCGGDRVGVGIAADTEAIENDEDDRPGSGWGLPGGR
jgi:hypothetical protein